MIDQFIVEQISSGNGKNPAALMLSDLLADAKMSQLFNQSFAEVPSLASLTQAGTAMQQHPDCRDVFVTEGGTKDEPVLGWLTNVDLVGTRSLSARA